MSKTIEQIREANRQYVENFGEKGKLPIPPEKKIAILTCMDARLDPEKFAGLDEGDAHVVRNAGGRASDDAIRSLIVSHKLLGTDTWYVIHHTDCGMETFTDTIMADLLSKSLEAAARDENGWHNISENGGSGEGKNINWLTIADQRSSVIEDVKTIRNHPLVSKKIKIYGFIYDVKTGKLEEVEEASKAGRPRL